MPCGATQRQERLKPSLGTPKFPMGWRVKSAGISRYLKLAAEGRCLIFLCLSSGIASFPPQLSSSPTCKARRHWSSLTLRYRENTNRGWRSIVRNNHHALPQLWNREPHERQILRRVRNAACPCVSCLRNGESPERKVLQWMRRIPRHSLPVAGSTFNVQCSQ